jgi:hypothetical protein
MEDATGGHVSAWGLSENVRILPMKNRCAICGKPATCHGKYEEDTEESFACDDCCGHGNEDGYCDPVESIE